VCKTAKSLITDGPFAETKEQLAGYYIVDCKNLDEAIEPGKRYPDSLQSRQWMHRNQPCRGVAPATLTMDPRAAAEAVFREQSGRIIATSIRISGSRG